MGVGKLWPSLKSTVLFSGSFFLTRIFFHAVLVISYCLPHNLPSTNHSLLPAFILGVLFLLHAFWFTQSIRGFFQSVQPSTVLSISSGILPATPAVPVYRLLARSNLWRRRRIHRRKMYDQACRFLPGRLTKLSNLYDILPEREVLYDVVGLGSRRPPASGH